VKRKKLDMPSKRKHTERDKMPTSLCEDNSEKIGSNISARFIIIIIITIITGYYYLNVKMIPNSCSNRGWYLGKV
jgi:hypothetical protein